MPEEFTFSYKLNKLTLDGLIFKGILTIMFSIAGIIWTLGSLAIYFVAFILINGVFLLYSLIKLQKESCIC